MEIRRIFQMVMVVCVVFTIVGISERAFSDTFSIDEGSPSQYDPADLLNPGISVQVSNANLGLTAGDELDALASGNDAVRLSNIVFFSVCRGSQGVSGGPSNPWDVNGQALLNQQAGDVFVTTQTANPYTGGAPQGINMLCNDQSFYGEIPNTNPWMQVNNTGPQDNLDALSFEEFDLNGSGVTDRPTFFSLGAGSTSLGAGSAADILISLAGSGTFNIFATAAQMGLQTDDDLDALALLDLDQSGTLTSGDMALFSLATGSSTLGLLNASAADVFVTTFNGASAVQHTAASLGLMFDDDVDALEVQIAPEPATLSLLGLGALGLLRRRRK